MKPALRVLHVLSNLGVGGAEVWLLALLRYFKEQAGALPFVLKTDLFLTHGVSDTLDHEAKSLGAGLYYSRFGRLSLRRFFRDWRRRLRRGRYHVIHDHQEFCAGIHLLMGAAALPPIRIAHLHNPLTHLRRYSSGPLRTLTVASGNWFISRFGTHVLSTSRQLLMEHGFMDRRYARLHREALYCGFDTSRFAGFHSESFESLCQEFGFPGNIRVMLFAARLDSNADERLNQKNPVFALEVAKHCVEKDLRIRFLMAGGGDAARRKLESRVQEWGLSDRIRLIGSRTDVPRLMLGSHLFLLPSLAEGLGMVVVEAQAAGLPSLVSDVTPRECAVVAPLVSFLGLAEGPVVWAEKALEMINKDRFDSVDSNAAIRNSGFSIENSATRLLEIYSQGLSYGNQPS